ncbi:hypothetical protein [Aeromonas veronii]|uniref:hypothetical protein n=1 Tax=Aeromonas veronii TaxID=654 RepID=UPI003EC8EA7A
MQEKVINLGRDIVSSLKNCAPDHITVWMINYLSEKMLSAENGDEKAKEVCCDTILKLWSNRRVFPNGARPFENFEHIFKVLDSLSPESNSPRYYMDAEENGDNKLHDSTHLVKLVKDLDAAARVLIMFLLEQAVELENNDVAINWIKSMQGISSSDEVDFFVKFSWALSSQDKDTRMHNLSSRITQLKSFEKTSKLVRKDLENLLSRLD